MLWNDFLVIVLTVWGIVLGITGITYLGARLYAKVKENQFDIADDDTSTGDRF